MTENRIPLPLPEQTTRMCFINEWQRRRKWVEEENAHKMTVVGEDRGRRGTFPHFVRQARTNTRNIEWRVTAGENASMHHLYRKHCGMPRRKRYRRRMQISERRENMKKTPLCLFLTASILLVNIYSRSPHLFSALINSRMRRRVSLCPQVVKGCAGVGGRTRFIKRLSEFTRSKVDALAGCMCVAFSRLIIVKWRRIITETKRVDFVAWLVKKFRAWLEEICGNI